MFLQNPGVGVNLCSQGSAQQGNFCKLFGDVNTLAQRCTNDPYCYAFVYLPTGMHVHPPAAHHTSVFARVLSRLYSSAMLTCLHLPMLRRGGCLVQRRHIDDSSDCAPVHWQCNSKLQQRAVRVQGIHLIAVTQWLWCLCRYWQDTLSGTPHVPRWLT